MTIRVPLIDPVEVIIYRLDIQATWAQDPPGTPTKGYDSILREPIISHSGGTRAVARSEMAPVTVPCQVETQSFEQLRATFGGDDPVTNMVFVAHRMDLESLGLLDTVTRECLLKRGDRIDHIEKGGRMVRGFSKPLFVYEVRPRSWGFGPDGYDLELLYTSYRSEAP